MESDSSSYPELKFLSEFAEIGKLRNRLPHWSQDRATCFITFRLGDSVPTQLLAAWRNEREEWLLTHAKPWSLESEMEYHKRFSMRIVAGGKRFGATQIHKASETSGSFWQKDYFAHFIGVAWAAADAFRRSLRETESVVFWRFPSK